MSRTLIDDICAALPGAERANATEGALESWKVGGKMFACFGTRSGEGVSVKTADTETARMLIDAGAGAKAPYFHPSWIRLDESTPETDLRHRIETSYDLIRAKLPKATRTALPPRTA
ncbi:MmcQ/YjbR family DNA-binding protein [Chachezhania antarctica]|uniref:MmcQ/YjbR family DNA-binding protein n=1 Tax=Chachezhania antarctica TaxID=2340860 RepID=UPI000EABBE44|nr:MmcQ/YjbR family DNA-binding protein [Chachezhania antarctica]|tara:strand:- start:182 stop:532 length:351 start_codon:yes stop_codon:yes gene_type:complete